MSLGAYRPSIVINIVSMPNSISTCLDRTCLNYNLLREPSEVSFNSMILQKVCLIVRLIVCGAITLKPLFSF